MTDTILGYLVSLGIIGAGIVWIVAGTIGHSGVKQPAQPPSPARCIALR
jgi:hypothetical protein